MCAHAVLRLHDTAAAVLAVGTELTLGLVAETNSGEVATALGSSGLDVQRIVTLPDEKALLQHEISALVRMYSLVVVTGGLGPTHDDVTREAAADALGSPLLADPRIEQALAPVADAHDSPEAAHQVFSQAQVIKGATVLTPDSGTAPGQIVHTDRGALVLLPGPPYEMRPMLARVLEMIPTDGASPRVLSCSGITESDAQITAQSTLERIDGVGLTLLAGLGHVKVVLRDEGIGGEGLREVAALVVERLGEACFDDRGATMPEAVISIAREHGATLATGESCTGGLVAAALTSVPGASDVFNGSIVSYADTAKTRLLGVDQALITHHGAVSRDVVEAMASGAAASLEATHAVAVTGIAGPTGGSYDKPVGEVWFAVASPHGMHSETRIFLGDREGIRSRAAMHAMHVLRRNLAR